MADINLADYTFTTAVIAPDTSNSGVFQGTEFTGTFDGNDHVIRNLTIDENNSFLGLFGKTGPKGQIKNLGIEDVNVTSIGDFFSGCLGGLVGYNNGIINNCYSTGTVTGGDLTEVLGGLVGKNDYGIINDCYSTCSITGLDSLGGLVGENFGTLTSCYAIGAVNGEDYSWHLGGLVGYNDRGEISSCYSTGDVMGGNSCTELGGLVGDNNGGIISDCYATGDVNCLGGSYFGGLVGCNDNGIISNCYATGAVTGEFLASVGGLVGCNWGGEISNCYAKGAVTGGFNSGRLGGLVGSNGGGIISNCHATGAVTGDVNSPYLGGLVGENYVGSTVSNCYAEGAVTGPRSVDYLGGLVGHNGGTISNCYAIGEVEGGDVSQALGGLVGSNSGTVSNCYATGAVTGWSDPGGFGGLIGLNSGTVNNCYSTGTVIGYSGVGGLVGDCNNSNIISSYFLINSGPDNGCGEPLTHEQMTQQSSFVGWDFVGETTNGSDNIWTINEDVNYPQHVWELVNLVQSRFPLGWYEVDFVDFAAMANWWGHSNCAANNDCNGADFNFSGDIDAIDLDAFCSYWLEGTIP